MPFYLKKGKIPGKRHTQLHGDEGKLHYEELISREGFSDIYSNVYHLHPPTRLASVAGSKALNYGQSSDDRHRPRHWRSDELNEQSDWVHGRAVLCYNSDVALSVVKPEKGLPEWYYRNGQADELIYVQSGEGIVHSNFGSMVYRPGDYIVIPRGIIYQLAVNTADTHLFITETTGPLETPNRYRNRHGQLLEHSPFSERDIRTPEFTKAVDIQGEFEVIVKLGQKLQSYVYANHPFDIVGWDGYYYPWILNINDFMPIVGKVHQPPPVHQTFQANGLVVCSFVPRLYDFHEHAIPAPYAHSNVDSDEILFYSLGNFMSRKGINAGSLSYHPMGLPHGPQPGRYEASIGKKDTNELAVMVDTFKPLIVAAAADEIDDAEYPDSWME